MAEQEDPADSAWMTGLHQASGDKLWQRNLRRARLATFLTLAAGVLIILVMVMLEQTSHAMGWPLVVALLVFLTVAVLLNDRTLRRSQTSLADNAEQFQRLLDMLPQMIFTCDAQAKSEYLNQRWVEYSGEPMAKLLGEGWLHLMHSDDFDAVMQQWHKAVDSNGDSISEFRLRARDGSYRWFSARFGVSRNERGQPVRWFGSSEDIDDFKRTQAALERSEEFHRLTLNALNEGVITFDARGRATGCNPAAERMAGMTREELLGVSSRNWGVSLQYEDGREMPWEDTPLTQVLNSGLARRDVLMSARSRRGERRWLRVNAEPVHGGPDGAVTAVVMSFTDVTERMRVHAELRVHRDHLEVLVNERTRELTAEVQARTQAEHKTRLLNEQVQNAERFVRVVADIVPGRIAYWDKDLRCRFVNRIYSEWFGDDPAQVIGMGMREMRGDEYFENIESRVLATLRGEEQDFERVEYNARGVRVETRVQYIPDLREGGVQGIVVLATDITRHKRVEQLLRVANEQLSDARDRATEASVAKSTFLANMSHEIRTPMNAIIGFTHMLRREITDSVNQQRLAKIANASNHLLQVINDVLDLSKIEAGKLALEDVGFSIDALLSRTCSMVAESAREKGLELVVKIETMPHEVSGDPTRLMQALLNLLSNAVKFTERGSVSLRAELLEQDGDKLLVRFEVRDTGMGIDPQEFARLFHPFSQADNSSTRQHGGTGLGLAITRHIAERMGGEAGGESQPGRGSRFWLTVRLRGVQQEHIGPVPVMQGLRALVADHSPQVLATLGGMLQGMGLRVDSVSTGTQALEHAARAAAQGDPYKLVLLDWAMPGLDGMETGARLSDALESPLAMVLLSAREHVSIHQLARDAGFGAVLMKPVSPSVLRDCFSRLLKNAIRAGGMVDSLATFEDGLPETHRGARILLAEDNPVNQEVAIQLLQAAGLEVDVADDGRQAVEMARNGSYELILMDMQMPHMDGLQATRELRQDPDFAALPIIAMTANAFQEARQACLDAGMNDHLAKPVDPRMLHAMLLRWLPAQRSPSGFAPLMGAMEVETPVAPVAAEADAAPKPPTPEARLASMASLVDLEKAYEYCAGQPGILMRVMQQFVTHYSQAGAGFVEQVASGQIELLARGLHSLRGVSGTMGATQLRDLTTSVEQGIKEGRPPALLLPQVEHLRAELDTLVAAITSRLEN